MRPCCVHVPRLPSRVLKSHIHLLIRQLIVRVDIYLDNSLVRPFTGLRSIVVPQLVVWQNELPIVLVGNRVLRPYISLRSLSPYSIFRPKQHFIYSYLSADLKLASTFCPWHEISRQTLVPLIENLGRTLVLRVRCDLLGLHLHFDLFRFVLLKLLMNFG